MTTKHKHGYVYLVGAGPGDPGLITIKGRECIARATVILYDYLANERLLAFASPDAEIIYAGKVGGAHNREQSQINDLIVSRAVEGHVVTRLKGGDSFIFGRGGEECEALVAAGIPFEVVPGVPAAVGAAAYAGIPLTHRGLATSVSFITGHESPEKGCSQIDWARFSSNSDTLVFYMGIKNLPHITSSLIVHGRDPETPAALIRWGTRPDQEVLQGTLGSIADLARASSFKPPAITVVGEVVRLRGQLRWFDTKPLFGRGILVTRAADQASEFSEMLTTLGATVYEAPTIQIVPVADYTEVDAAISDLRRYDWVIFSSVNAVSHFFSRLAFLELDSRAFGCSRICAVGPKTAAALALHGLKADLVPDDYKAEGVVAAFLDGNLANGAKILFPKADKAREVIPAALSRAGAAMTAPVIYRNIVPESLNQGVIDALEQGRIDCITFTSSSTVSNLAAILGDNRFLRYLGQVAVASIGPITSATCRELGLDVVIEPEKFTLDTLTEEIVRYFKQ